MFRTAEKSNFLVKEYMTDSEPEHLGKLDVPPTYVP
jgi:hypothetical protein